MRFSAGSTGCSQMKREVGRRKMIQQMHERRLRSSGQEEILVREYQRKMRMM